MSSSTSRKPSFDALSHPDVQGLFDRGREVGTVTADEVRTACDLAAIPPTQSKALLRMLSEEGVSVVVSAEDASGRKQVAAATSRRTTVSATATKKSSTKAPAKKAAAKKASTQKSASKPAAKKSTAKKAAAKKTADVETDEVLDDDLVADEVDLVDDVEDVEDEAPA